MRHIIIACDGTGQSASRGISTIPTNVTRLCRALSSCPEAPQIVFYQSGIGTGDLGWRGKFSQALGSGLEDHVADGYTFLLNNYFPGDKIFIFGFSRGAFTARVLANLIARLGIIWKTYSWAFKYAMVAYRNGKLDDYIVDNVKKIKPSGDSHYETKESEPWAYDVEIEVVGCWDTVASLGVPWNPILNPGGQTGKSVHLDGGLVKGIKNAFHALALDECRGPFTPSLWILEDDLKDSVNLKQCWFPGAHSNVGGGYKDRALANITLAWMIDLCRPFLNFNKTYFEDIVKFDRDPERWHKDLGDEKGRGEEDFDITYDGWGRGMWYDSYNEGETFTWSYRTPGACKYKGVVTNETIHASARERWTTSRKNGLKTGPPVWKPRSLKGFEPKLTAATGTGGVEDSWQWVKESRGLWDLVSGEKPLVIPEEPFPVEISSIDGLSVRSFESMLRYDGLKE